MEKKMEYLRPEEIEKRSFEIISGELAERGICLDPLQAPIIKRCIHTSADFDYAENLAFSKGAVELALEALGQGTGIVTDTRMAMAGIDQTKLQALGGSIYNFIKDEDVAGQARQRGLTRSAVSMEKAASLGKPLLYAIGNAPTALIRLLDLVREGRLAPVLVIGVPVGFVNVEYSKELLLASEVPYIVAKGRKGGSNIAAAICNALLSMV